MPVPVSPLLGRPQDWRQQADSDPGVICIGCHVEGAGIGGAVWHAPVSLVLACFALPMYRGPQLLWYTLASGLFCPLEPFFEGWRNVLPAI